MLVQRLKQNAPGQLGLLTRRMAEAGVMLAIARRECPEGIFELADLRDLPKTGTFDAVLASFCIVHLSNDEATAFLPGLPERMRPGAILHVSFMEGTQASWSASSFSSNPSSTTTSRRAG